jgi:two-component system chemotaxis sensor kinase CheA
MLIITLGLFYLHRLKGIAEAATEEIAVMKDSMGVGVFLMDADFIIQPQYSKPLETILGEKDLFNRKFTELLSSSLTSKEMEGLIDYFTMIINRSFDTSMLEDINPVSEVLYVSNNTREEKNLRLAFALVDRGDGGLFILGTAEDITSKTLLKKQLSEETDKREEEMRAFFEIIQVEPRVFNDFLEDTEYEFSRINDMLKNRALTSQFVMVDIYQSVHAIKSDAIILGLENFSKKMQRLESEIKKIRDKENIDFEDTLHITVEIERIMKEKDRFQEILQRIQSFKISDAKSQDEYVLIQTLTRASGKAARDLGKKVELAADSVDPRAVIEGPRRIIKEVLTQLVRNAVYHGIEDPDERRALGKNETGKLHLSIGIEGDKIHIILADDGRGLDFDSIRKKARELNLLKDTADSGDNKQLVQLIFSPGFSTAEDAGFHAGRGIGLSLVRDRLHDINGSIRVQTEQGKGMAFHIFIPLGEQDKPQAS